MKYKKYLLSEGMFTKAKNSFKKKRNIKKEHKFLLKHGWTKVLSFYYLYKEYGDIPFGRLEAIEKTEYNIKSGAYTL